MFLNVLKWVISIVGGILLFAVVFIIRQSRDTIKANPENIDKIISKINQNGNIAGFSLALVNSDRVLFQTASGFSNIGRKEAYTIENKQYLASVSKILIGIAILKCQELGYLNLDDAINKHLDFTIDNKWHQDEPITIRQLATHTSSLAYNEKVVESLYVADELKNESLDCFMRDYFERQKMGPITMHEFAPGEKFDYSNIGSGLAAYLVESVSGMTFSLFTETYIFSPLALKNTSWNSYYNRSKPMSYYSSHNSLSEVHNLGVQLYPARDLYTNVEDLSKLAMALLKRDQRLLETGSYNDLFKAQLDSKIEGQFVDNQGIFCMIDRNQYGVTYSLTGMNGGDEGINTMFWLDLKTKLGYLCISNTGQSKENTIEYIRLFRTLASLGKWHLLNDPEYNWKQRLRFRWHDNYSRLRAVF